MELFNLFEMKINWFEAHHRATVRSSDGVAAASSAKTMRRCVINAPLIKTRRTHSLTHSNTKVGAWRLQMRAPPKLLATGGL